MAEVVQIHRPERWDNPFNPDMTEADVARVFSYLPFRDMDRRKFPASTPLRDIIRNDMRIRHFRAGDIVVRAGDYGNSAFLVLTGAVRVVLFPGLPADVLGHQEPTKRGLLAAAAQLWRNPRTPEARDPSRFGTGAEFGTRYLEDETRIFLQDIPGTLERHRTAVIGPGEIFGEIAALGRTPRTASVFADADSELLEIRWQGIRDIRRRDDAFRQHVDRLYRERALKVHIRETPLFRHLNDEQVTLIADLTSFESYGEYDWYGSYKKLAQRSTADRLAQEPLIAEEGEYIDGIVMIRSGFARVSRRVNNGHLTVSFLGRGEVFGLREVAHNWRTGEQVGMLHSLRALGYVDILRVPTAMVEELILPNLAPELLPAPLDAVSGTRTAWNATSDETGIDTSMLEFLVENRYINGTAAMLIDLDRCLRCDDCVRACAAAHDNNPRFVRHGRRHGSFMIANACMHCTDPVCMIGCPTGAIHRSSVGGQVVINDDACVGCATCANSCPYDNIRMVEIRDRQGSFIVDRQSSAPIQKATKCDLCVDQLSGPACQRACPTDALRRVDMGNLDKGVLSWLNGR